MADKRKKKQTRRGREATTAAILDAAEELFSAHGYNAVAVRDIAERAGVSHPIVHTYVGSKADVLRAVLARDEGLIASAAPANPDLIESASLMLRHGLGQDGLAYLRLVARAALDGLPYDRTTGRFEGTERLIELAEQAAASAPPGRAHRVRPRSPRRNRRRCVALPRLGRHPVLGPTGRRTPGHGRRRAHRWARARGPWNLERERPRRRARRRVVRRADLTTATRLALLHVRRPLQATEARKSHARERRLALLRMRKPSGVT